MKKGINRWIAELSDKTELPLNEMCRGFSVFISGRHEITVNGVISIYKYETDMIIVEVCGDHIIIVGKDLMLKNFYQTTLRIGGTIDSVGLGGSVCP